MSAKRMGWTVLGALVLMVLGAVTGYEFARKEPAGDHGAAPAAPRILYWYDPMKPEQHFDKPGKSPFMDMDLVPMADEGSAADNGVRIDPRLLQNTGVRYATAEKGRLARGIEVVGTLVFDERRVAIVQARTGGLVERVYGRAPNDVILAGAPLADLRVPDWYGAQAEYLALRGSGESALAEAARTRLLQLGMNESQVAQMEKRGVPQAVVTVAAPRSGVLLELGVREGMTVMPGQTLARINGIDNVWLEAEVPEAQVAGLSVGQPVSATFTAWPGRHWTGRISALLPALERDVRTLRVRTEWANPDGQLRPGMYARIALQKAAGPERLLIPTEAVIATGKRNVVIVAEGAGRFRPADVIVGGEGDGRVEILDGLQQGDQVVVSGQFLIDSEASLKGVLARMEKTGEPK